MRLLKKETSKKPIIITVSIALALIIAGLLWYYALADHNKDTDSTKAPFNSQKDSDNSDLDSKKIKENSASKEKEKEPKDQSVNHEKEKELPQLYEGDNVNSSPNLTGVITSKSVQGNNLVIRNTINQLVGSGTCELTLTSNSKTVTKSVEIIQNPSSSACAGFDIPVSELGSGQWDIKIKITSEGRETILSDKVSI